MKEREIYTDIRALSPFIVRLDGRAFHRFSKEQQFTRPFDERFADAMAHVTLALLQDSGFSPAFGYTFSDEISLFFSTSPFDGRVEKTDSVLASFAASALTIQLSLQTPVAFDARIIPVNSDHIIPYLAWRQDEAWRNHINGWSQALLIQEGAEPDEAARRLDKVKSSDLHELCFRRGVNLAGTPAWQRRGILVYRKEVHKEGFNPITGEKSDVVRRTLTIDWDLPLFAKPEGIELVRKILSLSYSAPPPKKPDNLCSHPLFKRPLL